MGSKSQRDKTFQAARAPSEVQGQALDKATSLDTLRYVSPRASRDIFYCPQLREYHLQNKEQMVQAHTIHGVWVPPGVTVIW